MTNSAAHYRSGGLQPRCVLLICKIEAMPDSGLRDGIIRGGTRRITSTRQHRFQHPRDLRKEPVLRISCVIVFLVLSGAGGRGTNRAERPTWHLGCGQPVRTGHIGQRLEHRLRRSKTVGQRFKNSGALASGEPVSMKPELWPGKHYGDVLQPSCLARSVLLTRGLVHCEPRVQP